MFIDGQASVSQFNLNLKTLFLWSLILLTCFQPETSLWDTFLWWLGDNEVNDVEEGSRRSNSRKVTREKATRGLRHKAIPDRKLLKGREGRFKARRHKERQDKKDSPEIMKAPREKMKRLGEKNPKEEQREEEEEKVVKFIRKESKKKGT